MHLRKLLNRSLLFNLLESLMVRFLLLVKGLLNAYLWSKIHLLLLSLVKMLILLLKHLASILI